MQSSNQTIARHMVLLKTSRYQAHGIVEDIVVPDTWYCCKLRGIRYIVLLKTSRYKAHDIVKNIVVPSLWCC